MSCFWWYLWTEDEEREAVLPVDGTQLELGGGSVDEIRITTGTGGDVGVRQEGNVTAPAAHTELASIKTAEAGVRR